MHTLKNFLEHKAYVMRVNSLLMTTQAGSGHPTSALSAADIVSALFFYAMQYNPQNPNNPNNDRFILSKGHASPIFYAAWKEAGVLTQDQLMTYRHFDSVLEGHPTSRFEWTEGSTGSLGMGLSIGVGMAKSAKIDHRNFYTYVIMGDSEVAEGSVWEAAEIAAFYKLNNLVAILDCNRLGQSTQVMHDHHVHRYEAKFQAFGWKTIVIDGHDMQEIMLAFDKAKSSQDLPTIIIAKTFKGYGVDQAQNKEGFHGKAFSKKELDEILPQMKTRFAAAASFAESTFSWQPSSFAKATADKTVEVCSKIELATSHYKKGEQIATRKAYGEGLRAAGVACKAVVALDAEVKNSTFAEIFEAKFPERFIQCFVAEQNMVSMGVGLAKRGHIPFISTFASFFSRAHDQIRMAAIGKSAIRLCGSHAGVSIGEDGPSQMALEDIGMMRALPDSVVFYPSDAVSTFKLVEQMANYNKGISYLRTTRMTTPVLYDVNEDFFTPFCENGDPSQIGGCKIVRQSEQDKACIIGAGITLHEALKAYDQLQREGMSVTVIDLYCIKPINATAIIKAANAAGDIVITVEDHYIQGGLGEAVVYALRNTAIIVECLAVTQLPRSGKPDELLAWAGIDATAIVKKVKELV